MKTLIKTLLITWLAVVAGTAFAQDTGVSSDNDQAAPVTISLRADAEAYLQSLELDSPDIALIVRILLQDQSKLSTGQGWGLVQKLMRDERAQAKRAAADLLACENAPIRLFIMRQLPLADTEIEYFLTCIIAWWDHLWVKEKLTLRTSIPQILRAHNETNTIVRGYAGDLAAMMIAHPGKQVPLAGIELAKDLNLVSDEIIAALEGQRNNSVYDYFENEHPVRKAVLDLLGESYTPPERKEIEYSEISIAKENSLRRSGKLSVGVLTSLYTATGPSYGGRDGYGWAGQCYILDVLGKRGIETMGYCHPITEAEGYPITERLAEAGLMGPVLNSASVTDLTVCEVLVLAGYCNIRSEVVDALEEYVWRGGGLVTLDGAGIISCLAPGKFAALQDMRNLGWSWSEEVNETLVVCASNAITQDVDISLPLDTFGDAGFFKNGYTFNGPRHRQQILLRFKKLEQPALRISRYGAGRIAHFAWPPKFKSDASGERDWALFENILQWASGRKYTDIDPEPVFSTQRYEDTGR